MQDSVIIEEAAVSNSSEDYTSMSIPNEEVAVAAAINTDNDKFNKGLKVNNIIIDNYVKEKQIKPTFIKIDVEGAEFEVLKGAKQTLKKFKPVLVIEIHEFILPSFGTSTQEIIDYLTELGYEKEIIGNTEGKNGNYHHAIFTNNEDIH